MRQPIQFETPGKEADRTVVFWSAVLEGKPWQVRTTIEERTEVLGAGAFPCPFSDVRIEIVCQDGGTVLPVWSGPSFAGDIELVRSFPAVHEAEDNAIRIAEKLTSYDTVMAHAWLATSRDSETKEEA